MALFSSPEWVKSYAQALNSSDAYAEAAKDWHGDFYFVITYPGTSTYIYLDLDEGKCRKAELVEDTSQYSPEFEVKGTLENWKRVVIGEISPLQAIMSGRLALKGSMMKLMKQAAAAQELVNCTTKVDTEFPV